MNCQGNVNSTLPTQLPHKFSYIVAILGHNHFESPNRCCLEKPCWNLVRGHSSTICWMVSFSAPHSQEGFSRMFQ
jgi:hypothetical protein